MKWSFFNILVLAILIAAIIQSCKKEYSCEGCMPGNKPPIAIAGPDLLITLPTDSVFLNGTASSDPDGQITTWRWAKISGPDTFAISRSDAAQTKVTRLVNGIYQFELTVVDDKGANAKDTLLVTVNTANGNNQPPVACAGADQTITLPVNSMWLNGNCSTDPNNNITGYRWTKVSGPTSFIIANADAVQTQVTNLVEGIYLFQLKVTDAGGLFSMDTIQVTVISNTVLVDVYVAGAVQTVAKYWKNGQPVSLSSSTAAQASSIFVAGSDVYVAGMEGNNLNDPFAATSLLKYWRNGQESFLTGPTGWQANSIYVSNGDVYVAGSEMFIAKYWKNGQAVVLNDGTNATSIVVVGSDVYVAGYEEGVGAKYWKNGQAVSLPNGYYATSIAVVGNDVYVAGTGPNQNGFYVAKYWKNGQEVLLSNGLMDAYATSIAIAGNDVYVCGYENSGTDATAKYWKNGQEVLLSPNVANSRTFATSIAVHGNDVYVAGFTAGFSSTNNDALYWKNGQPVQLTSGSNFAQAYSIKVVQR